MRIRGTLKYDENTDIVYYKWYLEGQEPKAIIHISHGMAEHILRYDEFANKLVDAGFAVYGEDHYAHGESSTDIKKIGVITEKDFMSTIIDDMKLTVELIKKEHPGLPIYGFCHSMGSFAAQRYIQLYPNDYSKVILSGSSNTNFEHYLGRVLTRIIMTFRGKTHYSSLVQKMSIDKFNKPYKDLLGKNHWLSSVTEEVDKYNENEYCGAAFPVNYYYSLSKLMTEVTKKANYKNINSNLELFLISGSNDPVSNNGKGILKLYNFFKNLGLKVYYKLYENGRHELINEDLDIKNQVIQDIVEFYQSNNQ